MENPFISIKNLSHQFEQSNTFALNDFSIDLKGGQIIGIVGPDGAGKTTLLRILTGLLKPKEGKVIIDGIDVIKSILPENLIRYMPQKFGLYEDLTVIENLNLYCDLNSLSPSEKSTYLEKLLDFTNLKQFTNRLAGNLSGGMKQKLGLACTLLKKPKLLLLDEPTVGVDPVSRIELWQMIHHLIEDHMTIIVSTSYLDETEHFKQVIVINEGSILYQGAPSMLTEQNQNRTFLIQNLQIAKREALTALMEQSPVLDGMIQGNSLRILSLKNQEKNCFETCSKFGIPQSIKSRFEDAFLDLIPQPSKKKSPIDALYPNLVRQMKPMVESIGLTKKFGPFIACNSIDFQVKQGEVFGLLGPNGAGKSTIFKMLCGLIKPTSGFAKIKEISLMEAPHLARAKIGYMAQKFSLYSNMTVLQNLNFFYGIYPRYNAKEAIVEEMIEIFYLKPYLNFLASELPLGFKQRLALACAIMHRPEVLFLDEPTSGVDPITRREFWSHINALVQKNVTIIVTTHFMDEAEYCDRIGLINQGKLAAIGTPDELKNLCISENCPYPTLEEAFIHLTTKTRQEG